MAGRIEAAARRKRTPPAYRRAQELRTVPRATIDPEFYTYDGFRNWWRLSPEIYPLICMCCIGEPVQQAFDLCQEHDEQEQERFLREEKGEPRGQDLDKLNYVRSDFDAHYLVGW